MKLLLACAISSPFPGNFIASVKALAFRMQEYGYETIYAFPKEAKKYLWCQEIQKKHTVYFLPTAKARILPETYLVFRRIYRENKDIVIAHSNFELYDVPMTVTAPKGVKIFWHLHDSIIYEENRKGFHGILWKCQYGKIGKRATLISVSEKYRDEILKFGFPQNHTTFLPNGIELKRIAKVTSHERPFDFLFFGWDFRRKGGDILIDAGKRLCDEGYHFRVLFNGNDATWNELDHDSTGKNCSFIVRCDPTYDVNALYQKCKALISASRSETFSYAIAEAAYAGLSVISSDIDGVQWAKALPTVAFFQNENVEALYLQMKEYLDGKKPSADHIAISRRIIQTNYSVEQWTRRVIAIYGI